MTEIAGTTPESTAREHYLPAGHGRLYVREIGSGMPLVVIHGGPDFNHNYLLPEMDRLASAFRLIYYDQRGRGKSSAGTLPEEVSIDSEIEDLEALRRHVGLESVALLGHSWGCLLAMEYAIRYPERASHLVLLNTAPASNADLLDSRRLRQAAEPQTLAKMRAIASSPAYAEGDIETEAEYYRAHFSASLHRKELVELIVARLRVHFSPADIRKARAIEERLHAQTWLAPDYNLLARLSCSTARMLIIHGAVDMFPRDCAKHTADAIPGARLVLLEECGHFAFLECPERVMSETIAQFSFA
jgi:proline iminopeptidase